MKFLFDIFPVILFFAAFKGAEYFPDGALSLASSFMGDGVTATTAPVFIATVTAILATILQVGWLKLKGAKVEPMLWISLAVIVVFGGLTLWLKMKCSSNGNRRSSTGSSLRCSDTGPTPDAALSAC